MALVPAHLIFLEKLKTQADTDEAMSTQGEDSHLQVKEECPEEMDLTSTWSSGCFPPGLPGNELTLLALFKSPSLWYFVMAAKQTSTVHLLKPSVSLACSTLCS